MGRLRSAQPGSEVTHGGPGRPGAAAAESPSAFTRASTASSYGKVPFTDRDCWHDRTVTAARRATLALRGTVTACRPGLSATRTVPTVAACGQ
eukprot:749498-Hanusia_phi.AAC.2